MSHKRYEPMPHQPGPAPELVYSLGDYEPMTIGDIPEFAQLFKGLTDQIAAAQAVDLGTPASADLLEDADREIEFEVLPVGEGEARDAVNGSKRHREAQNRNIDLLFALRNKYGNESEVVRVNISQRDKRTEKVRPLTYFAAILRNQDAEVQAVVADSLTEDNALYVWRPDASDAGSWEEVFSGDKTHAKKNEAIDLRHRGDRMGEKVMKLLEMTTDEFTDVVTSEPGKRPRL